MTKERYIGIDIIRVCAITFVVAGHFFMNSGFSEAPFEGVSMFIQGVAKSFFGMGVPLFLMMTGYLNGHKEVNLAYYRSGTRVLVSYLFFSLFTILFRQYYLGQDLSWLQWGHSILAFDAIPYGWYIEMWIGLFLLTPFLNILWRNIPNHRQKLILLGSLYVMTSLPDLSNRYGLHLLPGFWQGGYPLLFSSPGVIFVNINPR